MIGVHALRSLFVLVWFAISACATTALDTASSGTWHEVRTPRFRAWTNGEPEHAAALLTDLERFHRIVLKTTSAQEREGMPPLNILIARNQGTFRAWTGVTQQGVAGLFRTTSLGNFAFVTSQGLRANELGVSARHILFHEYTHYLMASGGARVPAWYNEGFAEYMAATELRDDGSYRLGCPPVFRTRWVNHMRWKPLDELMEADSLHGRGRSAVAASDAYAQSWYAVHYFNEESSRQQQLARYLELVGRSPATEAILEEAFQLDYAELDKRLRNHSQKKSFSCLEMHPAAREQVPRPEVRALSKADAHYRVGELLLLANGAADAAREALDAALAIEPKHAGALGALARLHVRLGDVASDEGRDAEPDYARAERLLKDAYAIERDDPARLTIEGHLASSRAHAARKREDDAAARKTTDAARRGYRRAIHLDAAQAEALWGLGYTYLQSGDSGEEGQVALEGAAYLLPLQALIPIALGKLHLARNEPSAALAPLEHAERWARDDAQRKEVRELLEQARSAGKSR